MLDQSNNLNLNPVVSCSKSLLSFSADNVTTGTYNLRSVMENVASVKELS